MSSNWREESSVNGVGWTDISLKHPEQMVANDRPKWRNTPTAAQYNGPTETQCWTQETQGTTQADHNRTQTKTSTAQRGFDYLDISLEMIK